MDFFSLLLSVSLTACVPLFLVCAGLLLIFVGCWALRREVLLSKQGVVVPGRVVAIDTQRKRTRGRSYTVVHHAVVTFQPRDFDEPVTFVSPVGSGLRFHRIGQTVKVIYSPAGVQSAHINDSSRWIGPWIIIGFGLVFATFTVILASSMITIRW